jgi:hypothetical protein
LKVGGNECGWSCSVVLQSTCCLAPHSQTCCFRGVPTVHRPHRRFDYTEKQEQPAAMSTVFSSAPSSCFSKHAWPLRPRQHLQGTIEHPPAPAKKDQRRERRESIKGARRDALRRKNTKRRRTSRGTDRRNNGRRRAVLLKVRRWYRQTRRRGGRRSRRRGLRGRRHRRSGMRGRRHRWSGRRKQRRGWSWRRRRRRRRGQPEGLWHEGEGLKFVLGVVVVVVVSVGLLADGSMGGIGLELTCC